jgi:hypothetical protein
MGKQDTFTFQFEKGYREIVERIVSEEHFGSKRSAGFVVNEYLRRGFIEDGFLPKPPRPKK